MCRVSIVYRYIPWYRRDFYPALEAKLREHRISLRVIHGDPTGEDVKKGDAIRLPDAEWIRNLAIGPLRRQLIYQPALHHVRGSDLVIVEQASKLLINYILLASSTMGGPAVAFWGHGSNMQSDGSTWSRVGERVKRHATLKADWFFAYSDGTRDTLIAQGFDPRRITVVHNAIPDSEFLHYSTANARSPQVAKFGHTVAFVGSLYREKRLAYLCTALDILHAKSPDVSLKVIGDGPLMGMVKSWAETRPWAHVLGRVQGEAKVRAIASADLLTLPASVGLVAFDSFASGIPIVTLDGADHGPEFEYLVPGQNSIVLPQSTSPEQYADSISAILSDVQRGKILSEGAAKSGAMLTTNAMAERFVEGVLSVLGKRAS